MYNHLEEAGKGRKEAALEFCRRMSGPAQRMRAGRVKVCLITV